MAFRKARIADLEICADCRYSRLCGGGCRSNALLSYGRITAPDPRACVAMQMLEDEILPELPGPFRDRIAGPSRAFALPTGFRHCI